MLKRRKIGCFFVLPFFSFYFFLFLILFIFGLVLLFGLNSHNTNVENE